MSSELELARARAKAKLRLRKEKEIMELEESELDLTPSPGYAETKIVEGLIDESGAGKAAVEKLDKVGEKVSKSKVGDALRASEKAIKTGLSKVGNLSYDDLELRQANLDRIKELKKSPGKVGTNIGKHLDRLKDESKKAKRTLDTAIDSDKLKVGREDFLNKIKETVSGGRRNPSEQRLKEVESSIKDLKSAEKKLENLNNKQAKDIIQKENKLAELEQLKKEYMDNIKSKESINRAEKMVNAEKKTTTDLLDKLDSEKFEYDDKTASKQINEDIRKLKVQDKKLEQNLKDLKLEEGSSRLDNIRMAREKAKEASDLRKEIKETKSKNKKDLKVLQDRVKEAKANVEKKSLKKRTLPKSEEAAFSGLSEELDDYTELKGKELKEAKAYADQFNEKDGDKVRQAVRKFIRDNSPEARKALDESAEAITNRENLMKLLGIDKIKKSKKGVTTTEEIFPTGEFSRKLAQLMRTEKGADIFETEKTTKAQITELLKEANVEEIIDPITEEKKTVNILSDLELNRILKDNSISASVIDLLAAIKTGGLAAASTGRVLGSIGSKAQTLGSDILSGAKKVASSPLGKTLGKVGKGAAKALPLVGAGFDYAEAKEMGLEGPELAAYVAGEQLNPLPVSSGDLYKIAKEAEKTEEGQPMLDSTGLGGVLDVVESPVFQAGREGLRSLLSGEGLKLSDDTKKDLESYIKGLDTKLPKDLNTYIKDINNSETLSNQLRGVNEEYANRIDSIKATSENKDEYERKISMLNSEPAFRELVRRQMRRMKNEQGDRD